MSLESQQITRATPPPARCLQPIFAFVVISAAISIRRRFIDLPRYASLPHAFTAFHRHFLRHFIFQPATPRQPARCRSLLFHYFHLFHAADISRILKAFMLSISFFRFSPLLPRLRTLSGFATAAAAAPALPDIIYLRRFRRRRCQPNFATPSLRLSDYCHAIEAGFSLRFLQIPAPADTPPEQASASSRFSLASSAFFSSLSAFSQPRLPRLLFGTPFIFQNSFLFLRHAAFSVSLFLSSRIDDCHMP